jgi:energy-coupling factor transport system ATP-binding protein
VLKAAGAVGIDSHLLNAPDQLSGGQKQRVAMAGVMVDDVEVFLFDEPLANLDPATGKSAMELIDEIHDRTGAAVIIIEHRLEDVLHRNMDRIVLMNEGRIIADMDPDTLLSSELLRSHGIREPLYVTALKYAGVRVTPELKPSSIRSLRLGPEEKQKVLDWYRRTPPRPAPPPRPVLLKAEDVTFSYDGRRETLSHISLEIFRGESLAIVGTNGAGKSTFSKVVCGFEKPQSGTLGFTGLDWPSLSLKERADHVGYVMQNPNQMISKPMIFDEVAMGLRNRNVPEEEIRPRVEQALKTCGLWPFRNWPVSALSFGQKKRVTIASILVLEPEIIILDEPTAGQDYRHYTEILEFLRELNARGVTVVMITHDMHLMLEYAERSVVFSQGRVLADDSSAAILTDPDLVRRASLKETSLYDLALLCGIDEPKEFVQRFIDYEREAYRS